MTTRRTRHPQRRPALVFLSPSPLQATRLTQLLAVGRILLVKLVPTVAAWSFCPLPWLVHDGLLRPPHRSFAAFTSCSAFQPSVSAMHQTVSPHPKPSLRTQAERDLAPSLHSLPTAAHCEEYTATLQPSFFS